MKRDTQAMAQMLADRLAELDAVADVMLRGYVVRSKLPLLGRPLAWLRRNLTSHLREPYVDPTFERQVAFNSQVVSIIGQVAELLSACVQELGRRVSGAYAGATARRRPPDLL